MKYSDQQRIHDYDGTNWNIIAEVVFEEIPVLIEQLKELM